MAAATDWGDGLTYMGCTVAEAMAEAGMKECDVCGAWHDPVAGNETPERDPLCPTCAKDTMQCSVCLKTFPLTHICNSGLCAYCEPDDEVSA